MFLILISYISCLMKCFLRLRRWKRKRLTHPLAGRPSVSVGLQPSGIGNLITLDVFKDAPHGTRDIFS